MNAYEFALTVENDIESLSKNDYFLHKGAGKKLLEEKLPIARLALALKQPGLNIDVQAFDDNGEADGLIVVSGFKEMHLPLQVTYCYGYEEALRNEELATTGSTFGAGPINRNQVTGKIESTAGGLDLDEHIDILASEIVACFKKKEKKSYSTKMVLIIAFDHYKLSGLHQWAALLSEIDSRQPLCSDNFIGIYLFNEASNEINGVYWRPIK